MPPFIQKNFSTPGPVLLALALGVCAWIKAGPNALAYLLFLVALVAAFLYLRINMSGGRS